MNVGASVHSSHRGDQNSSSAEVPSRALLISRPSSATVSVIAMPMLIQSSRCCAARRAEPIGAARNAAAIGSIRSGRPEAIGRPGAAVPPHQIAKAPTVASSAPKHDGDLDRPPSQFAAGAPQGHQPRGGEDVDGCERQQSVFLIEQTSPGAPTRRLSGDVCVIDP